MKLLIRVPRSRKIYDCHQWLKAKPAVLFLDINRNCRTSLDINPNRIRCLPVHRQHNIYLAAPDQATRHLDIDLVKAREITLRSGIEDCRRNAADGCCDVQERAQLPEAGTE